MHLDHMALFVEVVKAKSFRRAAEALGMPNSTVSRRINELEKAIGLRLLYRTTRRIELTEAGQIYFDSCKRIVNEARLAHEQLGEVPVPPSGILRASLPVDFAASYLAPLIVEFAHRYPGLGFEFDLTPRNVDLVAEPFDIAVRMRTPSVSNLVARKIAYLTPYLYASPLYLERSGEPADPSDLMQHECLDFPKATTWKLHGESGRSTDVPIGGRFRLNSPGMIRRLATLDLGIAMLLQELAIDEIADGRLRRVLPKWTGEPVPVYALTETRLLPAKTQRFIEFLQERLRGA